MSVCIKLSCTWLCPFQCLDFCTRVIMTVHFFLWNTTWGTDDSLPFRSPDFNSVSQNSCLSHDKFLFNYCIFRIDLKLGRWYVLETNYDHWKEPLFLDDRRTPAIKCMNQTTQKVSTETLWRDSVLRTSVNIQSCDFWVWSTSLSDHIPVLSKW